MRNTAEATMDSVQLLGAFLRDFLAYIVDYKGHSPATARAYEHDCTRLLAFLTGAGISCDPSEIRPRDIRLFLASLSGLSASSIRRTLYGVSSFFQYLVEMEIIPGNPAAPVDPPKLKRTLPRVPSRQQCSRILEVCHKPTETVVIGLLVLAGLRRSEVLGLDVADIAADLSSLRVVGKGGAHRVVPASAHLAELLEAHLSIRDDCTSPALIVNGAGKRMQTTTFYRLFKRILGRAGLQDSEITPHSLRHAFATELVHAGVDVATISELLGHSNISTTSIYLHATPETKRDAVERLQLLPAIRSHGTAEDLG